MSDAEQARTPRGFFAADVDAEDGRADLLQRAEAARLQASEGQPEKFNSSDFISRLFKH